PIWKQDATHVLVLLMPPIAAICAPGAHPVRWLQPATSGTERRYIVNHRFCAKPVRIIGEAISKHGQHILAVSVLRIVQNAFDLRESVGNPLRNWIHQVCEVSSVRWGIRWQHTDRWLVECDRLNPGRAIGVYEDLCG